MYVHCKHSGWAGGLRPEVAYRLYLKFKFGTGRLTESPVPHIADATVKSRAKLRGGLHDSTMHIGYWLTWYPVILMLRERTRLQ